MKKNFILLLTILSVFVFSAHSFATEQLSLNFGSEQTDNSYNEFEDDIPYFEGIEENERPFYFNYFDGAPKYGTSYAHKYLDQQRVLALFEDYMSQNDFPTTDEFIVFLQDVISGKCRGDYLYSRCHMRYYKYTLQILRSADKIDNLFFLIVDDRIRNYQPSFKDLAIYLRSLKSLYFKRLVQQDGQHEIFDLSFMHTRSLSQSYGSYRGLTPRQVLHLKYDSFQIKYLGHQLKKMINIMNSENAYIHVDMEAEDISDIHLELSYTEKYRLGVKLLKFHLNELQFDSRFGFKPRYIDVLLSGVETGVISPELLKEFYSMPEFFDSYRNRYSIYKEALKRIGKQILINTPVVGQLAFIPIMIIEIRNELRNSTRGQSDDTQLF